MAHRAIADKAMLFWNVMESQTALHCWRTFNLTRNRMSFLSFLCVVYENYRQGKSKYLSELTNIGNCLPKLDLFQLFSAFLC